jgi:hypothetical protein
MGEAREEPTVKNSTILISLSKMVKSYKRKRKEKATS